MSMVITVDDNVRYLDEMMDDLPHNAYIDKGITNCGATTLVLTNNENYVIAVHSIALLENKCEQHPNVLGVHGDINLDEIRNYLDYTDGVKKIIVTYDSLPRLLNVIDPSEFRLLVDEVQVLIRYVGQFKQKVCNDLIEKSFNFKSVSYMTATPTPKEYLPKPMKKLQYISFKWNNVVKQKISNTNVGNRVKSKCVAYILDKWKNTSNDIFIFYNSKSGVANAISDLLKAESDITMNSINIFFSKNDKNEEYFKTKLGKATEINIPLKSNTKRINFVSSFGFEGVDFYNKFVNILVVSDPKYKSMRYDIAIDLPQIVGRFRRVPNTPIDFIWSTYNDQEQLEKNEYINKFINEYDNVKAALTGVNASNPEIHKSFYKRAKVESSPYFYIERDDPNNPLISSNKYAFESMMSSFYAMYEDYYVKDNSDKELKGLERITSKFDTIESLDIPRLELTQNHNLGKIVNFKIEAKKYVELQEQLEEKHCLSKEQELNEILELVPELKKYHNIISYKDMRRLKYVKKSLNELYDEIIILSKITKKDFTFKKGKTYSLSYIETSLQRVYNKYDIDKDVNAKDIKKWFKIKSGTYYSDVNKKNQHGYKFLD